MASGMRQGSFTAAPQVGKSSVAAAAGPGWAEVEAHHPVAIKTADNPPNNLECGIDVFLPRPFS
jgi:hypothetical protein